MSYWGYQSSKFPFIFNMEPISVLSNLCLLSLSSARGLFPPGSGSVGSRGPHGVQGNCSSQSSTIHWRLHHPGHGRHALPPGLPWLLWSYPWKQVSAPLCKSADKFKVQFCYWSCLCACVWVFWSRLAQNRKPKEQNTLLFAFMPPVSSLIHS